ncbi:MAG TPA: tRNA pseudouridine synthase A, partial [Chloroflexota bacterium]|nr:tRNA pseudouridine synthase A [Chloroflexota bacterium]
LTQSGLEPATLRRAANAVLVEDVAVLEASEATPGFNARRSARSRTYRYSVWNAEVRSVWRHRYTQHWRQFLDVELMDEAVQRLVGHHDFAAFCAASHGRERPNSTVRSLYRAHWWREGALVSLEVVADAFLPHMVRNLVGTLLLVGMHQATPDKIVEILASGDRRQAGRTAPAKGLCLTHVQYV